MTNEKMLELLNDYMKDGTITHYNKLEELKKGLIENIRLEVEKSKGTKTKDITIMKRVWKDMQNGFTMKENYFGYHDFDFFNRTYKAFTDGTYIVASEEDFGYPKAKERLKLETFFDSNSFDKNDKNIELKIDRKDIQLFQKTHKKSDRVPYIIEDDNIRIGFNVYHLKNVLDFCNTDTIYVTKPIAPAFVSNQDKSRLALVLPVNLKAIKN